MFFELKAGDKTVHTHSTLVDESKQAQIQTIYDQIPAWQNGGRFLSGYLALEAVNRIPALKHLNIYYRVGIVAVPVLLGGLIGECAFWKLTNNWAQVKNHLAGAPVYSRKVDVPELNKVYFFLDDDNNYKPSLNHHSVTKARTYHSLYKPE